MKFNILNTLKNLIWKKKHFPHNIIVTAAHGSFKIPLSIFPKLSREYQMSPRLLLNFSDYGTKYLVDEVPPEQRIIPKYGRMIGDPNRARDGHDLIRFKDFSDNPIFSEKFEKRLTTSWFHTFWLNKILKLSYTPFYDEVFEKISTAIKNPKNDGKPIILVDVHDAGNLLLGPTKSKDRKREGLFKMPKIIISNAPDEQTGEDCFGTAPDYLLEFFQESLSQKCGFKKGDVRVNFMFLGGNVTRYFGNPWKNERLRKILNGRTIYSLQIEFDRAIYMDEPTQKVISKKMKLLRNSLMETLREMEDILISGTD